MSLGPRKQQDPLAGVRLMTVSKRLPLSGGAVTGSATQPAARSEGREMSKGSVASSSARPRSISRESGMSKVSVASSKRSTMSKDEVVESVREKMTRPPDIAPIRGGNINVHQVTPSFVSEFWTKMKKDSEEFRRLRSANPVIGGTANHHHDPLAPSGSISQRGIAASATATRTPSTGSSVLQKRAVRPSPSPNPRPVSARTASAGPATPAKDKENGARPTSATAAPRAFKQASSSDANRQAAGAATTATGAAGGSAAKRPVINAAKSTPGSANTSVAKTSTTATGAQKVATPIVRKKVVIVGNGAPLKPLPTKTAADKATAAQPLKATLKAGQITRAADAAPPAPAQPDVPAPVAAAEVAATDTSIATEVAAVEAPIVASA